MKNKNGFNKFTSQINNISRNYMQDIVINHKNDLTEVMVNYIFNSNGPKKISRILSEDEKFFKEIFYLFNEIINISESVVDHQIYIRRFPYQNTRIEKSRHLRHNVESFINDVSILKYRLIRFSNKINKLYKSKIFTVDISEKIKKLNNNLKKSFEPITEIRDAHIHIKRFDDYDLSRLEGLELLLRNFRDTNIIKDINLSHYINSEYKVIRKRFSKEIKTTISDIKIILDEYFTVLSEILFDDRNKLKFPSRIKHK